MVSDLLRPPALIVVITGLGGRASEVVERILIHRVVGINTSAVVDVVGGINTERIT